MSLYKGQVIYSDVAVHVCEEGQVIYSDVAVHVCEEGQVIYSVVAVQRASNLFGCRCTCM